MVLSGRYNAEKIRPKVIFLYDCFLYRTSFQTIRGLGFINGGGFAPPYVKPYDLR
jgi:hypothetical protein